MSTQKHTPGPWQHEVHESDERGTGVIWSQNPDWSPGSFLSPNGKIVAQVPYNVDSRAPWRGTRDEEFEANARLIAAAPDLLEAAGWAIDALFEQCDPAEALVRLKAAITKAEGRSG